MAVVTLAVIKSTSVPVSKHHAVKAYRGRGGKTQRIPNLGTRFR